MSLAVEGQEGLEGALVVDAHCCGEGRDADEGSVEALKKGVPESNDEVSHVSSVQSKTSCSKLIAYQRGIECKLTLSYTGIEQCPYRLTAYHMIPNHNIPSPHCLRFLQTIPYPQPLDGRP